MNASYTALDCHGSNRNGGDESIIVQTWWGDICIVNPNVIGLNKTTKGSINNLRDIN